MSAARYRDHGLYMQGSERHEYLSVGDDPDDSPCIVKRSAKSVPARSFAECSTARRASEVVAQVAAYDLALASSFRGTLCPSRSLVPASIWQSSMSTCVVMCVKYGLSLRLARILGLEDGENVCVSKEKHHLLQLMGSAAVDS